MLVKTQNGSVETYPYSKTQLRKDNPNTSFPKEISNELMESYGVYEVNQEEIPSHNQITQYVLPEEQPVFSNNSWVIGWTVHNRTESEIVELNEATAQRNREKRSELITETDWWALPDSPTMTAEQTAYRQALRDITTHANWPYLEEADWPTKP